MSKRLEVKRENNPESIVLTLSEKEEDHSTLIETITLPTRYKEVADMIEMTIQAGQMFGVLNVR